MTIRNTPGSRKCSKICIHFNAVHLTYPSLHMHVPYKTCKFYYLKDGNLKLKRYQGAV